MKILCADDNASLRGMIHSMLGLKGVEIDFAANGLEAVSACQANEYDAILMDIDMPLKSGLQAAREIRAIENDRHARHTPVLFLTGTANEHDVDRDMTPGDGHIVKPFSTHALINALSDAVAVRINHNRAAE